MMTQPLRASIVSAPLAAIDRRELSQAWCSALGYASNAPRSRDPQRRRAALPAPTSTRRELRSSTVATIRSAPAFERLAASRTQRSVVTAERNVSTAHMRLARAILRAFATPARPPLHAAVRIEGSGGRVLLLLRETAGALRLVAICRPEQRALVARALDRASRVLAARGIGVVAQTWN
jgi:hypothetical protein